MQMNEMMIMVNTTPNVLIFTKMLKSRLAVRMNRMPKIMKHVQEYENSEKSMSPDMVKSLSSFVNISIMTNIIGNKNCANN